ncbi:MAG: sensor histidine kinase [Dehalococcoidia bacterium]
MKIPGKALFYGTGTLLALTALVLLLTRALLQPPARDLLLLGVFLLVSGGLTLLLGLGSAHLAWPRISGSLRSRFLLASVLTVFLSLANVGFIALLMFLEPHDLALLVVLLGFALGISVFLSVTLSSYTTGSLDQVMAAVAEISEGNLNTKVPVHSADEIGRLSDAFNLMTERLESSFLRERELEQARKELIGSVSHDLRTPLASIRAMVESINDGVATDPETKQRYLKNIESEVESLSQLIDDLFELSQIDAGVLELHLENASVTDLISDTLESMSAQAAARRLSLEGSVEGEVLPVLMDPRRVQRVLYNLVQNAIRHTPADGAIHISARDSGNEVMVEVRDTGEGIPEEELPRLFERFYRPDQSRSRDLGGSGLGLSIAQGIVQAHGGRLWVKSIVGQGSTFGFALPKVRVT